MRNFEILQENKLIEFPSLTSINLSSYLLKTTKFVDSLHYGAKKSDILAYFGKPDEQIDHGRNENLGEHFYEIKYNRLNLKITFHAVDFLNEGKDFRICNIVLYDKAWFKTQKGIGIGSSVEEVLKKYAFEMKKGNVTYQQKNYDDKKGKMIHLGFTEGLIFTFTNDKVDEIHLGVFQWN